MRCQQRETCYVYIGQIDIRVLEARQAQARRGGRR